MKTGILSLLLATSLAAAAPVEERATDPCAVLANANPAFFTPSQVRACFKSVPFSQAARTNILAVVRANFDLNPFKYHAIHDDTKLNQGVDVEKELARIEKATYASDYDFQHDLSYVMYRLNDGHAGWDSCYDNFRYDHDLPLVALSTDNSAAVTIKLPPDLPSYAAANKWTSNYKALGIDLVALTNATVNKINGRDAWDYLENVATPAAGTYQDPQQRLSSLFASWTALTGGGYWIRVKGKFAQPKYLPDVDTFTMSVTTTAGKKVDVTVPWYARYTASGGFTYQSGTDFWQSVCTNGYTGDSSESTSSGSSVFGYHGTAHMSKIPLGAGESLASVSIDDVKANAQEYIEGCPLRNDTANYYPIDASVQPVLNKKFLGGRDIQFYKLDRSNVGVIYVATFEPQDPDDDNCRTRFLYDAVIGVHNFTQLGIKKVLIDTSNNGGGYTYLSMFLTRLLTGAKFEPQTGFDDLFARTPLSEAVVDYYTKHPDIQNTGGSWTPQSERPWPSVDNFPATTNFMLPGKSTTVNGHTLLLSNDTSISLDEMNIYVDVLGVGSEPAFAPENIYIVGNGLCGSACSALTNFLIEYYDGKGYINTPRPAKQIEFAAFAACQVYDSDSVWRETSSVGFKNETLLPEPIYVGKLRFPFRGSLSPNVAPGKFLQYRLFPAQHTYSLTSKLWSDPIANWEYVASKVF